MVIVVTKIRYVNCKYLVPSTPQLPPGPYACSWQSRRLASQQAHYAFSLCLERSDPYVLARLLLPSLLAFSSPPSIPPQTWRASIPIFHYSLPFSLNINNSKFIISFSSILSSAFQLLPSLDWLIAESFHDVNSAR